MSITNNIITNKFILGYAFLFKVRFPLLDDGLLIEVMQGSKTLRPEFNIYRMREMMQLESDFDAAIRRLPRSLPCLSLPCPSRSSA